jgi:hypothetical protein
LVFRKFAELGTVRQTLMWFLEHGLEVPTRSPSGKITWNYRELQQLARRNFLAHHDFTLMVKAYRVKHCLPRSMPNVCSSNGIDSPWVSYIPTSSEEDRRNIHLLRPLTQGAFRHPGRGGCAEVL